MKSPVSVKTHERQAVFESFGLPSRWEFVFECGTHLPRYVETCTCKLLNELLHVIIAKRKNLDSVAQIAKEDAEALCREMERDEIQTIHGAVIWSYAMLAETGVNIPDFRIEDGHFGPTN